MTEIESLQAQIDDLRRIIGDASVHPDKNNPPAVLENGRYPLIFSDYQLHLAADDIYKQLGDMTSGDGEYPDLTAEDIAWLLGQLGLTGNVPAPSPVVVTQPSNVFTGDVEIHGRLFLGDAIAKGRAEGYESAYALQIMCDKSATISGVSNLDRLQFQNLTPHFGYFTFNYDGGILHVQNAGYLFRDGVFKGVDFIDPTREISTLGVDSRGTVVYDLREPGREYVEGDKTQTVWIRPDEDLKTVDISAPRVGFTFRLRGSSYRDPILKVILDRVKQLLWD